MKAVSVVSGFTVLASSFKPAAFSVATMAWRVIVNAPCSVVATGAARYLVVIITLRHGGWIARHPCKCNIFSVQIGQARRLVGHWRLRAVSLSTEDIVGGVELAPLSRDSIVQTGLILVL